MFIEELTSKDVEERELFVQELKTTQGTSFGVF